MAQGTGLPGLPQPGDFATEAQGPDPASAGAGWAATAHIFNQASEEFDGAANLFAAHQQVVDQGQVALLRSKADGVQEGLASANQYDAQGFQQAAGAARSDFLKSVPPRYAQAIGQYWDLGAQTQQNQVAQAGMARDHVLAVQGLEARAKTVGDTVGGEYESGAPLATVAQSPAVLNGTAELGSIYDTLQASKAYAPEQIDQMRATQAASWKASAFQGHVLQTLQSQGSSAAIGEIERLQRAGVPQADGTAAPTDPNSWEAGVSINPNERALMVAKARAAATAAISLQQEQTNLTKAQADAAATALDKKASDSVAQVELTGKPDPGITAATFSALGPGGNAKYVKYLHDVSDAQDKHNTNGDLASYATPEAAAQHITDVGDLKDIPKAIGTQQDFDGAWEAVKLTEHGVDRSGRPLQSPTGALGVSQLEPGTARMAARKLGATDPAMAALANLPDAQFRAALLNRDQSVNERLGRQAWADALASQNGDPTKAYLAYHNGPGAVAGLIGRFGDPTTGEVTMGEFQGKLRAAGYTQTADAIGLFANAQKGGDAAAKYHALQQTDAWQVNRSANVGDPLQFAATHGRSDIQPLNLNGFAQPGQAQAWGQALVQRNAQGQNIAQAQGVPARLLTNGEASAYRDRVNSDPTLGPQLAAAATRALGTDGAVRFMREIGQTDGQASVGVQMGLLSASGPSGQRFVGSVTDGLQAKQAGQKEAPLPKHVTWETAQADVAPAFAHMGAGTLAATVQTAQLGRLGDSAHGLPGDPDIYLRSAMGGTYNAHTGESFGGVAPVNGQATIHPTWMLNGAMPTAMNAIASSGRLGSDPPVYTNGQVMRPQDIQRMRPEALPGGTYVLRDPRINQFARTKSGAPYEMNFDANKAFLARRGGIVLAGS